MPILKNAKYEMFAHAVASGIEPPQAAESVGYSAKSSNQQAWRLLQDAKICERVRELQTVLSQQVIAKAAVDKQWVINNLIQIVEIGMRKDKRELKSANRALELIGKELGMFVDRKEVRHGRIEQQLIELTDEQLDQLIAAIDAGTPAEAYRILGETGAAEAVQESPAAVLPTLQ